MQKTSSFAAVFLDFVMVEFQTNNPKAITNRFKINFGAVPGALGGDSRTFFSQHGPRLENGYQKAGNLYTFSGKPKIETRTNFSWSCSLLFVEVLVFSVFADFG